MTRLQHSRGRSFYPYLLIAALSLIADPALRLPEPFACARTHPGFLWSSAGPAYGLITIGDYIYFRTGIRWLQVSGSIFRSRVDTFYVYGAIFLEFLLRLDALCIFFWLLHSVILRGSFRSAAFRIVNCVVASYEIVPYLQDHIHRGNWPGVFTTILSPLYWSNVFEGWLLLRFGWFAPILFRGSFCVVWHILFGGLAKSYFVH